MLKLIDSFYYKFNTFTFNIHVYQHALINLLTAMELYDDPKKGICTDTGILEVESSSLAGKLMSPAVAPNG